MSAWKSNGRFNYTIEETPDKQVLDPSESLDYYHHPTTTISPPPPTRSNHAALLPLPLTK
jgi:hypothetical protein